MWLDLWITKWIALWLTWSIEVNKKWLPKELSLGPHFKDLWKCLTPISIFYYYEPFKVIIITLLNYIKTVKLQFSNSVLCRQTGRCACVALWESVSAEIRQPLPFSLSSCINSYVAVARRSGIWNEFYCLLDFCLVYIQMVGRVFSLSCSLWQCQAALLSLLLKDRLTVSSFQLFFLLKDLYRVPVLPDSEIFVYKNLTSDLLLIWDFLSTSSSSCCFSLALSLL